MIGRWLAERERGWAWGKELPCFFCAAGPGVKLQSKTIDRKTSTGMPVMY